MTVTKEMLKMQQNALQSKEKAIQKKFEALLKEESEDENDNYDAEKKYLLDLAKEAKEKEKEVAIELSIQEQEEQIIEEESKHIKEEQIARKMLAKDDEKLTEKPQEIVKDEPTQTPEIENEMDPRLLEMQKELQKRGINSTIEGTGNMQYLRTDQEGVLKEIDPNKMTIDKVDQTLKETSQEKELVIETQNEQESEDYRKRIMEQFVNPERGSLQDLPPYTKT